VGGVLYSEFSNFSRFRAGLKPTDGKFFSFWVKMEYVYIYYRLRGKMAILEGGEFGENKTHRRGILRNVMISIPDSGC